MARASTPRSTITPAKTEKVARAAGKETARPAGRAASPGRPARLSREMILEKAVALLAQYSTEGYTLARVADALGTVSMALYNYFPSREALIGAVADHICKQFRMPKAKPGQSWQDTLRAWFWAVKKHAERNPVIFKVMGVDGQTSAGWLRIAFTVGRTLQAQGLQGKELALNSYLFCSQTMGLLQAELSQGNYHTPVSFAHLDELDPPEQEFFARLLPYHAALKADEVLAEGFDNLIADLERRIAVLGK